jgi:hypothetical protein
MEDKLIKIKELPQDILDFINMPAGIEKAILYKSKYNRTYNYVSSNIKIENEHIYYSHILYNIKKGKNNNFYLKAEKKSGITIDPKGKLQVWFGSSLAQIFGSISNLTTDYLNYLTDYTPSVQFKQFRISFFTNTIVSKIATGKITSDLQLIEAWLKNKRIKMTPKVLLNMLSAAYGKYAFEFLFDDYKLGRMLSYVDNPDAFANMVIESTKQEVKDSYTSSHLYPYQTIRMDMIEQAEILGKKLNYKWSYNRMKEEHTKWTEELLGYEVKYLDESTQVEQPWHKYFHEFADGDTQLVSTTKEIYMEASLMKHCLYTGYKDKILSGHVLCYHTTKGGVDGTLTLYITTNYGSTKPCIQLMQFFGIRNESMPRHIEDYYVDKIHSISSRIPVEELKNNKYHVEEEEFIPF